MLRESLTRDGVLGVHRCAWEGHGRKGRDPSQRLEQLWKRREEKDPDWGPFSLVPACLALGG